MGRENETAPQKQGAEKRRGSRSAQVMNVIVVKTVIGQGTENDPNRIVTEFWSLKGELLAVSDPEINSSGPQT